MRTKIRAVLLYLSMFTSVSAGASPPASPDLRIAGEHAQSEFLNNLQLALKYTGKTGARFYYRGTCAPPDEDLVIFPMIASRPPPHEISGLDAIRAIFPNDANVLVTEGPNELIRMNLGSPSADILLTNISNLSFPPLAQYNATLAIATIENSSDVKAAMASLGVRPVLTMVHRAVVSPAAGLPHLPSAATNMTVDELLNLVAKTFSGIVLYGACPSSNRFYVNFAEGARTQRQ